VRRGAREIPSQKGLLQAGWKPISRGETELTNARETYEADEFCARTASQRRRCRDFARRRVRAGACRNAATPAPPPGGPRVRARLPAEPRAGLLAESPASRFDRRDFGRTKASSRCVCRSAGGLRDVEAAGSGLEGDVRSRQRRRHRALFHVHAPRRVPSPRRPRRPALARQLAALSRSRVLARAQLLVHRRHREVDGRQRQERRRARTDRLRTVALQHRPSLARRRLGLRGLGRRHFVLVHPDGRRAAHGRCRLHARCW
jgi:hypothetical protein